MSARILVVDDEPEMCAAIEALLVDVGHAVETCLQADVAFERIIDDDFDVLVTDVSMRGMNGLELCDRVVQNRPDIPVIVVSALGTFDTAVATIKSGAFDFLPKPYPPEALVTAVDRALRSRELRAELRRLEDEVAPTAPIEGLVGESAAMIRLRTLVRRASRSDANVFLLGESGTGKERIARAIHELGPRSGGRMVVVSCASLPRELVESELFGHVRGAFTDAHSEKRGLLVEANGGTLFLDEVGEMAPDMQAKLLRALQERRVRPVGSSTEIPFDARVIAATHRDIEALVVAGAFREDLFFRLHVIGIEVPPLRSRGADVLLLARAFLERLAVRYGKDALELSRGAAAAILSYGWPGNVRELQNALERAAALCAGNVIEQADLPRKVVENVRPLAVVDVTAEESLVPMADIERRYILHVYEAVRGNKSRAARILGIDRTTLQKRLEAYGVTRERAS